MKKFMTVRKPIQELLAIQCDACGRDYSAGPSMEYQMETQEFISLRFTGGYTSVFGGDTTVEADIC